MKGASPRSRKDRGIIIIWVALFLTLILGFIALGIDVSKLMATRSQLQNAADSAALAGASAINPATGDIVAATAVQRAQETGALNRAFVDTPQPVVVDAADVVTTAKTCQVTVRREGENSMVTYIAKVLGVSSIGITATATAEVDIVQTALCGVVPLTASPIVGQTFQIGQVCILKFAGGQGSTGWYNGLDLDQCKQFEPACAGKNGASLYSCLLAHNVCCEMHVGDVLRLKNGDVSGPSRKGIEDRFANDTVKAQDITYSQYLSLGGNGWRVVVVPITTLPAGQYVTIQEFGTFFLRNIPDNGNQSEIDGEFIYATTSGIGGGSGTGAVALAVHLIN